MAAQTADESRAIGNSPVLAEVFQNKREVAPEFPGGINALVKFISDNLKYPTVCKELKIQGKVMVKFTVKSDGSIGNAGLPSQLIQTWIKRLFDWSSPCLAGLPAHRTVNL